MKRRSDSGEGRDGGALGGRGESAMILVGHCSTKASYYLLSVCEHVLVYACLQVLCALSGFFSRFSAL